MSQCRVSCSRTAPLGNRLTSVSSSRAAATWPNITRPLEAPRSTAAMVRAFMSTQESGGHAGVDGNVQAGGTRQLPGGQYEHRVGDVLGQHLPFEQGAL